jgi:hypothetical protein
VESQGGRQFPDRPEEEQGPPGPAERRIEDGDPGGDESPAEERVEVIKAPRDDELPDPDRG